MFIAGTDTQKLSQILRSRTHVRYWPMKNKEHQLATLSKLIQNLIQWVLSQE